MEQSKDTEKRTVTETSAERKEVGMTMSGGYLVVFVKYF